jgi:ribosomal 50S subunit-recycling heat shock protein
MRLDLFLKASRICARRTLAQKLCDAGHVLVNGVPAKSAHSIKAGDEVTVRRRDKVSKLKVLSVPDQRQTSKHDARNLYELLEEAVNDDSKASNQTRT